MQLGADRSGFSGSAGSTESTSSAAADTRPDLSASATSDSFRTAPREVLISFTPCLVFDMNSAFTMPRVLSFSGQ